MLDKLIKHDWKRMWKIPVLLIILLNVSAFAAGSTFSWNLWDSEIEILNVLAGLIMIIFVCGIMGASLGIYIYLAVSFYKSTYSDEGYLLHTLPVTPREILFSKIIVMSVLQLLVGMGIVLSFFIMIISSTTHLGLAAEEVQYIYDTVVNSLNYVFTDSTPSLSACIILWILLCLVSMIYSGVYIVSSVSLGQLAKKHRIGASILAAVVINICVSTIFSFLQLPVIGFGWQLNESNLLQYIFLYLTFITIGQVVVTILLYIISEYIMTKKLNLE